MPKICITYDGEYIWSNVFARFQNEASYKKFHYSYKYIHFVPFKRMSRNIAIILL